MTIGIGAFGPKAGAAVLAGWAEAERIGSGSIGGFAVLTAITEGRGVLRLECQRGGLAALRRDREADAWNAISAARVAGVITSGPDRPEPLAQFLAASPGGLVTGHRLPNRAAASGQAMNLAALDLIEAGMPPDAAVARVTAENPEVDAGLIGVTRDGIGLADTRLVLLRDDRGALMEREPGQGRAILHNSITPVAGLARAVADAMIRATQG